MKTNPFSVMPMLNLQIGFDRYLHIEATLTFDILQINPKRIKK